MNKAKNRRRQLRQGASYHVGGKINRGEIIFDNDVIENIFYDVIRRCKKKFDFKIYDFSVMGNHVHYMINPEKGESLPKIMQWINSVFAKAYNKKMGIHGKVWQERYFSVIIETVQQFVNTFEYIVKNPVAGKLVKYAKDYPYSGLYHYLHKIEGIIDIQEQAILALYEQCRYF